MIKVFFFTALLIITAVVAFNRIKNLNKSKHWLKHSIKVIPEGAALKLDVIGTESDNRIFLITGNKDNLLLAKSLNEIKIKLNYIVNMTSDKPVQQSKIQSLNALIKKKLNDNNKLADKKKYDKFDTVRDFSKIKKHARLILRLKYDFFLYTVIKGKLNNEL